MTKPRKASPKSLAESTDDLIQPSRRLLPAPDPKLDKAPAPTAERLHLNRQLFDVSPQWDDILRSRTLSKPEDFDDLLDKVRVVVASEVWPDLFELKTAGEGDSRVYEVTPRDGKEHPTRLDVLEDAGEIDVLLNGKQAAALFVDTVRGGEAILERYPSQASDKPDDQTAQAYKTAAYKGQVLVARENWTTLVFPPLPPRSVRTVVLIRLL